MEILLTDGFDASLLKALQKGPVFHGEGVLLTSGYGMLDLLRKSTARDVVLNVFAHGKFIGHSAFLRVWTLGIS